MLTILRLTILWYKDVMCMFLFTPVHELLSLVHEIINPLLHEQFRAHEILYRAHE
jgi:hypothetical protein